MVPNLYTSNLHYILACQSSIYYMPRIFCLNGSISLICYATFVGSFLNLETIYPFNLPFQAKPCLSYLASWASVKVQGSDFRAQFGSYQHERKNSSFHTLEIYFHLIYIHIVWKERNAMIFQQEPRTPNAVASLVLSTLKLRIAYVLNLVVLVEQSSCFNCLRL